MRTIEIIDKALATVERDSPAWHALLIVRMRWNLVMNWLEDESQAETMAQIARMEADRGKPVLGGGE